MVGTNFNKTIWFTDKVQEWGIGTKSLFFYTPAWDDRLFNDRLGFYRNSGLFHEPGGYGVLLILAIVANTLINRKKFDKINIILMFCLITTLSTVGYMALFVILSVFLLNSKTNLLVKGITILLFFIVSYKVYQTEEFLQSKIEYQYEDQLEAVENNIGKSAPQSGRIYAFYTSLNFFMQNPIFGRGIINATGEKAKGEMHVDAQYGYGFIGILATYGLFFGLYFFYGFYKGIQRMAIGNIHSNRLTLFFFIAINLTLLTQVFTTTIFFVFIVVLGVYRTQNKK